MNEKDRIKEMLKMYFEKNRDTHRRFRASRLIRCIDFQFYQKRMQKGLVRAMRREAEERP